MVRYNISLSNQHDPPVTAIGLMAVKPPVSYMTARKPLRCNASRNLPSKKSSVKT